MKKKKKTNAASIKVQSTHENDITNNTKEKSNINLRTRNKNTNKVEKTENRKQRSNLNLELIKCLKAMAEGQ